MKDIIGNVISNIGEALDDIGDKIEDVKDGIIDGVDDVRDKASEIIEDVQEKVEDVLEGVHEKAEDIIDDLQKYGAFNKWNDIFEDDGYFIQCDGDEDRYRLIDKENELICIGSRLTVLHRAGNYLTLPEFMSEEIENVMEALENIDISAGDILCVDRFLNDEEEIKRLYRHFAVYVGDNRVIHYAAENGEFSITKSEVHEASIIDFIQDADCFYKLNFDENGTKKPVEKKFIIEEGAYSGKTKWLILLPVKELLDTTFGSEEKYKVFSPEETIARARERLGEREYNLATNNCEHFAIWCKTGMEESYQVEELKHALMCIVQHGRESIVELIGKWIDRN